MLDEIRKILKEEYNLDQIELSTKLKKDLGLSSFDFVNLICMIEDTYQIELDDEKYFSLETIQELVDYLTFLVNE